MCSIGCRLIYILSADCVDTAIAEHVSRLRQQATDAQSEVSRLQTSLDEMRRKVDQQIGAAVDAERQRLEDEFSMRLDAFNQQRK